MVLESGIEATRGSAKQAVAQEGPGCSAEGDVICPNDHRANTVPANASGV